MQGTLVNHHVGCKEEVKDSNLMGNDLFVTFSRNLKVPPGFQDLAMLDSHENLAGRILKA